MARLSFDVSQLRILLVEDDEFSREQQKTALEHVGVKFIVVASDGVEALAELEQGTHIDLIVSDWAMPNLDGLELLAAVRSKWPDIPFLMVTGNESDEQIKQAEQAGVDGYLTKPFTLDGLRELFQETLSHRLTAASAVLDPELVNIGDSIQSLLAEQDTGQSTAITEDALALAQNLSHDLHELVRIASATPAQFEVIRLHVECINALLTGQNGLTTHENQNLIVDGLALARALIQ
jgi:two-component system, chemotaxis family, chemotaxis protein CheY